MRAYGLPRHAFWKYPDMGDAREFGLASHRVNLPGKGGDIRAPQKSAKRRKTRRFFARKARAAAKNHIRAEGF